MHIAMHSKKKACKPGRRTGFTLVEVLVAGVIIAFIIGSVSTTVGQLARTKNSSKHRLTAHLRADAALNALRADLVAAVRDTDLFYTHLQIVDDLRDTPAGIMDRDELLVFNTKLRSVRDLSFQGEGLEYESQYRIEDDEMGPVLWQRRDSVPDEYTLGGGQATPKVEGILGLSVQAYDGLDWHDEWDSDDDGLPLAVRITVTASGHSNDEDLATAPVAILRTVVSIDRVVPPRDWLLPSPEEELELDDYLNELLANFGQQTPAVNDNENGEGSMAPIVEFDGSTGSLESLDGFEGAERIRDRRGGGGGGGGANPGGGRPGSGGPSGTGSGSGGRPTGANSGSSGNQGVDE